MSLDVDDLLSDPVRARSTLLELAGLVERQSVELETLRAQYDHATAEIEKYRFLIKQLQRMQFGAKSELRHPDQLQLGLEDLEQSAGAAEAGEEEARTRRTGTRPARPAQRNRGSLPSHLPRFEVTIDIEDKSCPCCGGALHLIAEDCSEMLDVVPAQFWVKVTRRPRYGCRTCTTGVVQMPAPERPIDGGMASEALLAHILVAKFADHLPLYRQAQIYARQGIELDRSTLANWVGRSCWWLTPLYERLLGTVLATPRLFADDTPLPVLDPGRGRTKTGRLWAYAIDDRPWGGPAPPAVAYVYEEDRKGERPADHLAGFSGILQVDAYAGFKRLLGERPAGPVHLALCWAHCRRRFYEIEKANGSPMATEALRRIGDLYEIEARVRGLSAEQRMAVRQDKAKPVLAEFKTWLQERLAEVSGKSKLAEAIRYALGHWAKLIFYLEDGRAEIDSNTVERTMRPIALGRKNALFAGSDGGAQHWAIAASLINTAKLNGLDPEAYLRAVLERIVSRAVTTGNLDRLLPWNWAAERAEQQRAA